jgi:hypothetical protein
MADEPKIELKFAEGCGDCGSRQVEQHSEQLQFVLNGDE